jgi:hypothetical protein
LIFATLTIRSSQLFPPRYGRNVYRVARFWSPELRQGRLRPKSPLTELDCCFRRVPQTLPPPGLEIRKLREEINRLTFDTIPQQIFKRMSEMRLKQKVRHESH